LFLQLISNKQFGSRIKPSTVKPIHCPDQTLETRNGRINHNNNLARLSTNDKSDPAFKENIADLMLEL
jgi:hypothetical protein